MESKPKQMHRTKFGYCTRDLSQDLCKKLDDCLDCEDHVHSTKRFKASDLSADEVAARKIN